MKGEESGLKNEENSSKKTISLPGSLINTYFQIFEVAVNNSKTETGKKSKTKDTKKNDLAMKSRLLGALLTGVNRAHPYLPTKDIGMEQHIDSLYRIAHVSPPSACTQALMLLFHLAVGSPNGGAEEELHATMNETDVKVVASRKDRFYRVLYEKLADSNMLAGRQLTLFFNLLYKAMKYDNNQIRVIAFGKRLLHISFHNSPSVVSGAIFLLSEVMKHQPLIQSSVFSIDGNASVFDPFKREPTAAFMAGDENLVYDASAQKTAVEAASLWEVSLTMFHYHPTVSKFSSSIKEINYSGDPLIDFGLVPFLDKFAFRNPKSNTKISEKLRRGESVGERKSGLQGNLHALSSLPMNDPKFWTKGKVISEQDNFFQKFFAERAKRDEIKGIVRGKKEGEEELDAMNAAEAKDVDFDWATDEEEEAFVEKLAESLMENHGDDKPHFDDEDPDMDDWSDYDGSESEDDGMETNENDLEAGNIDDDINKNDDHIHDGDEMSDSSDSDGEVEFGMPFGEEDFSSDDDDNQKDSQKVKKEKTSSFAPAEDYEEALHKSFVERMEAKAKRSHEESGPDDKKDEGSNPKRKKTKRKKSSSDK